MPNITLSSVSLQTPPSPHLTPPSLISRPNLPRPNITKLHRRIRLNPPNTIRAPLRRTTRSRTSRIQPVHEPALIPPDAKREHHAPTQRLSHAGRGAKVHEPRRAGSGAVVVVDVIHGGRVRDVYCGVGDDFSVLHVETVDLLQGSVGVGVELGDYCKGQLGVDVHSLAVEVVVVEAVWVIAAAVFIADAVEFAFGTGALV